MQKSSLKKFAIFGSVLTAVLIITIVLIASNVLASQNASQAQGAPTATATVKGSTPTATPTPKPTSTPKPKPTSTPTPTPTEVPAPTPTPTPAPIPTQPPVQITWNNPATTGYTLDWANIRTGPYANAALVEAKQPGSALTLYGKTYGETISGNALWYRVSDANSSPLYVYGSLITTEKPKPPESGKVIVVNLSQQHLYAYYNDQLVMDTVITSGQPGLETPTGTNSVYGKGTNLTFISPWPKSSPYYYEPTVVPHALLFREGGFYIHDAPWREVFGPGSNVPHTTPSGHKETGSHGCINVPSSIMPALYDWATIGTVVKVTY